MQLLIVQLLEQGAVVGVAGEQVVDVLCVMQSVVEAAQGGGRVGGDANAESAVAGWRGGGGGGCRGGRGGIWGK